jgi:hypothetical protein
MTKLHIEKVVGYRDRVAQALTWPGGVEIRVQRIKLRTLKKGLFLIEVNVKAAKTEMQ